MIPGYVDTVKKVDVGGDSVIAVGPVLTIRDGDKQRLILARRDPISSGDKYVFTLLMQNVNDDGNPTFEDLIDSYINYGVAVQEFGKRFAQMLANSQEVWQ